MSYPNNQGNPLASIPVWLDVAPVGNGPFPNDPGVSGGAMPVYEVLAPVLIPNGAYPNDQSNPAGAIPIRIVPRPTGPGPYSNDPALDSSAKPVWVVSSATGILPVYPNNPVNPLGAMPVYLTGNSLAAQAMMILASYPAGTVHLYLPANAYSDAGGTTPSVNGGPVVLVNDGQGNIKAQKTSNDLATPTFSLVNGFKGLVFAPGSGQSLHTPSALYQANADHCVITGIANTNPDTQGVPLVAPACNLTTYAKAASLYFTSATQITARWTSDVPKDYSIVGACPNAPVIVSAGRIGNTGFLRINGADIGTVDLTGLTATVNSGTIGPWVIPPAAASASGGVVYPTLTIASTVTPQNRLFLERWLNTLAPTGVTF